MSLAVGVNLKLINGKKLWDEWKGSH
jgi:hypothetical protein